MDRDIHQVYENHQNYDDQKVRFYIYYQLISYMTSLYVMDFKGFTGVLYHKFIKISTISYGVIQIYSVILNNTNLYF